MGMLFYHFTQGDQAYEKYPFSSVVYRLVSGDSLDRAPFPAPGDASMKGTTSLLMFPIYGCASLILPVYKKLKSLPALLRGSLYTAGFYLAEFASGSILQAFHMCPWDYSGVPHQYKGIIRLDYLPVWFLTGLFFEKILTKSS